MSSGFFVHNLGCKVNRVESDTMAASLIAAGATQTSLDEAAVVLINTCTVTAEADTKARKAVRQALRAAGQPWVIVTGCAAMIDPQAYAELDKRVLVLPDKPAATDRALALCSPPQAGLPASKPLRTGDAFPTRMGIKIQDGCDNRCSYCIVNRARGTARSVALTDLLAQAQAAESGGVREIVLTGVNLGSYSSAGVDLVELLQTLLQQTAKTRYRLSSLEPPDLSDALIATIACSEGRLCAHLHLPLQSGCDSTLRAMGRLYDTAFFSERVQALRKALPQVALTTDVIVGFPGETTADFEQSYAFCQRIGFSRLHVFRYSKRTGTPAACMPLQVSPELKAARSRLLRELSAQLQERDLQTRVGTQELVIVEKRTQGTSESYLKVEVPGSCEPGSLVRMQFTGYRATLIHGSIIAPID
ncbi:MAG: tRNA (N(6)-L-threonylcarbamoyladenosine(37)-C(2))-methylthiotransferase MtaB [Coriobacteriales bacterium]|jgi:threonylcarbamoyladenosine tRNA methylthiotransferase MtaB|nr:tRNA (N(6)-L-threonylcarbamoyladenosine(37)-C(2))-methylthiotransferase MtaB [Coriobacteriales bacterium]